MQALLQCCVSSLLLITCLYVCNTSSQRNRVKTLEVPVNNVIRVSDGRQHYFNFTSEFIAKNPLVKFESSEKSAHFYVSVMDTNLHAKNYCMEPINIIVPAVTAPYVLCHGISDSITVMIGGNFSIQFKLNLVNHSPTEVHVLRYLLTTDGVCPDKTDHQCSFRCFGKDAMCDGQKHCRDGSDESNCSSPTSSSTYSTTTTSNAIIITTPAGSRRCDLPGAAVKYPPENQVNKSWSVAVYSTGIIISTVLCSIVIGFCFMQPSPDNEDEQQDPRRAINEDGGERRLDSFLDHPPSYEDVMSMDLSAQPRRHAVPKPETPESP